MKLEELCIEWKHYELVLLVCEKYRKLNGPYSDKVAELILRGAENLAYI